MTSQCLLGFLTLVVAAGISLPQKRQSVRACGNDDCHAEAPVRNQSKIELGSDLCDCCWQDCGFHPKDMQEMHGELSGGDSELDSALADADAWLIANSPHIRQKAWNLYTPILETVKEALEDQGAMTFLAGAGDLDKMIMGVRVAVSKGKRPLVFTVAHEWWAELLDSTLDKLKTAKEAGAYLVSYNAEPGLGFDREFDLPVLKKALDMAERMGADELWDYTLANVKHYPKKVNSPILRFVPPGYLRMIDVDVNVNSHLMQASMIGYMGANKSMSETYYSLLGDHLHATHDVWSNDDLRTYLETYPLQLNQHRWQTCCPRDKWETQFQHFESFRMSALLANKACVISGPSSDEDMNVWKDVVTFVEVEDTMSTIQRLGQNLAACRLRSYETYKREFAPEALLSKAGFFQAWQPPHGL